jgi:DNA-binding MarR family transcriptional regulator
MSTMYYNHDENHLYVGGDGGLIILNLTNRKYEHYNKTYFLSLGQNYTNIQDLDYNYISKELYIATTGGLFTLNTTSKEIGYLIDDADIGLSYSTDVNYVKENGLIYISGHFISLMEDGGSVEEHNYPSLLAYNTSNGNVMTYPSVKAFWKSNGTVYKTIYDSINNVVVGAVNHIGAVVFKADEPIILKNPTYSTGYTTGDPLFAQSFPTLAYNENDERIYLGNGPFESILWGPCLGGVGICRITTWTEDDNVDGRALYSYSYASDNISTITITNEFIIGEHPNMHLEPSRNQIFLTAEASDNVQNLLIIDTEGNVVSNHSFHKFYNGKDVRKIYDIEFIDDIAYIAPTLSNGQADFLITMNLTTEEFSTIQADNLTSPSALFHPKNSDFLYVSVLDGITRLNLSSSSTDYFPVPSSLGSAPEGLAVTEDEAIAYHSSNYEVSQLNLTDGSSHILNAPFIAQPQGKIEIFEETDLPISGHENLCMIEDGEISVLPDFPETATLSSFDIDQQNGMIYAVTGYWVRGIGASLSGSEGSYFGLITYDLNNNDWIAYNMSHGLPNEIFSDVVVNSGSNMIFISGENFFAYANLSELEEFDPQLSWRAIVPEAVFVYDESNTNLQNAIAAGGTGLIALISSIFIAKTELGIYSFFKFIMPFYSKIKKDDVLDNFVRGQIFDYIRLNPGTYYTELKNELGLRNGTLTHHLHMLEIQGFINSKREGIRKLFYPVGMKIPEDGGIRFSALQSKIIDTIKDNPGISQTKIAKKLDLPVSVVNYNVKVLGNIGVITITKKGRTTYCYIE